MLKVGSLRSGGSQTYKRKQPGVNLTSDYLSEEEIDELSSEVTVYNVKELKANGSTTSCNHTNIKNGLSW